MASVSHIHITHMHQSCPLSPQQLRLDVSRGRRKLLVFYSHLSLAYGCGERIVGKSTTAPAGRVSGVLTLFSRCQPRPSVKSRAFVV